MEFWCPENGAHTTNSSFPRSELEENGTWARTGTNKMSATVVVNNTSATVTIGQIHLGTNGNPASTKPLLELQYSTSGNVSLFLEQSPAGGNGISYSISSTCRGRHEIQLQHHAGHRQDHDRRETG